MSQSKNHGERPWWLPKEDPSAPPSVSLPFGPDVKTLLSGAQRMVDWFTSSVAENLLEPHARHEVPEPACALCQAEERLAPAPSRAVAPVIVWHSVHWKGQGSRDE